MYWKVRRFYEADNGANGGASAEVQPVTSNGAGEDAVFTPEQQAKIDALIDKAFARGAAKAAKEAEAKALREKQTEAEKLAADRAELEAEKAKIKVQGLFSKEGLLIADDIDSALVGLFATAPDVAESNLAMLKKLINTKVNQEVDKRLKATGASTPISGEKDVTVGDAINGMLRKNIKK